MVEVIKGLDDFDYLKVLVILCDGVWVMFNWLLIDNRVVMLVVLMIGLVWFSDLVGVICGDGLSVSGLFVVVGYLYLMVLMG